MILSSDFHVLFVVTTTDGRFGYVYIGFQPDLIDYYLKQVFILKGDDLHDARKALPAAARGDAILPDPLYTDLITH